MENTQQEINETVKSNNVVLFMKGTKAAPQCGFSNKVSGILNYMGVDFKDINVLGDEVNSRRDKNLFRLANSTTTICKWRVCWRMRHNNRNDSFRRT